MRALAWLFLIALAVPAAAQRPATRVAPPAAPAAAIQIDTPSPCAALPEAGAVAVPAKPVSVAPQPTPEHGWLCPDDFTLDLKGRRPLCHGGLAAGPGKPRAECYARLALGPIAPLPERRRPAPGCQVRSATTVLALRGANIGWREVGITAVPADDVQVTSLFDVGAAVPAVANPVVRGCLAPDCRLVRVDTGPEAAAEIALVAALPGGASAEARLRLRRHCPLPAR